MGYEYYSYRIDEFIHSHPPGRALDLSHGTGINLIQKAKHGGQNKDVEFEPLPILVARRKAQLHKAQVEFHIRDKTRLDSF